MFIYIIICILICISIGLSVFAGIYFQAPEILPESIRPACDGEKPFTEWSECYDDGMSVRTRPFEGKEYSYCGYTEEKECKDFKCEYSAWSEWSDCANGKKTRTRTLTSGEKNVCKDLSETQDCTVPTVYTQAARALAITMKANSPTKIDIWAVDTLNQRTKIQAGYPVDKDLKEHIIIIPAVSDQIKEFVITIHDWNANINITEVKYNGVSIYNNYRSISSNLATEINEKSSWRREENGFGNAAEWSHHLIPFIFSV